MSGVICCRAWELRISRGFSKRSRAPISGSATAPSRTGPRCITRITTSMTKSWRSAPATGRASPRPCWKDRSLSPLCDRTVEAALQRVAEQVAGDDGQKDHQTGIDREEGGGRDRLLRIAQHCAPACERRLNAEPEKAQD